VLDQLAYASLLLSQLSLKQQTQTQTQTKGKQTVNEIDGFCRKNVAIPNKKSIGAFSLRFVLGWICECEGAAKNQV